MRYPFACALSFAIAFFLIAQQARPTACRQPRTRAITQHATAEITITLTDTELEPDTGSNQEANLFLDSTPVNTYDHLPVLQRNFHILLDILEGSNATHWVEYGTLLGCWRNGTVIAGDFDVDASVLESDFGRVSAALQRAAVDFGIRPYDTSARHGCPKAGFEDPGMVDVYTHRLVPGPKGTTNLRICLGEKFHGTLDAREVPSDWVFPLARCDCEGRVGGVACPRRTRQYLENRYGYLGYHAVRDPVTGHYRPRNETGR